jgi:hypothetical protein
MRRRSWFVPGCARPGSDGMGWWRLDNSTRLASKSGAPTFEACSGFALSFPLRRMEHPAKGLACARLQRTYRGGSFDCAALRFAQDDHGLGKVLALPPFALRRIGHPLFVLIDAKIPRLASQTLRLRSGQALGSPYLRLAFGFAFPFPLRKMEHPAKGLAFARLQRTYRCGSFDFAQDDHGLGKVLAFPPFALRRMGHPFSCRSMKKSPG